MAIPTITIKYKLGFHLAVLYFRTRKRKLRLRLTRNSERILKGRIRGVITQITEPATIDSRFEPLKDFLPTFWSQKVGRPTMLDKIIEK